MRKLFLLALFLTCYILPFPLTFAQQDSAQFNQNKEPLKILNITPTGEDVPVGREIVFQFSRSVVPVGRMARKADEIPITIEPNLVCEWRWLNTSSLACQLGEKSTTAPATRYKITVQPGIKTEDGSTLIEEVVHTFITQRPKIINTWFQTWKSPGIPVIRVTFDQAVVSDSIEKHVYLQTEKSQRWALRVEEAKNIREDLNREGIEEEVPGEESTEAEEPERKGLDWIVSPIQELPQDTRTELHVEPGVIPTQGMEPGVENRVVVEFYTFPPFRFLGVGCITNDEESVTVPPAGDPALQKPGATAVTGTTSMRCNPIRGGILLFSAPVIKEGVKEGLKVIPDLAGGRKDYDLWESVSSYSNLSQPHSKDARYELYLPGILRANAIYHIQANADQIKDEFGRSLAEAIDVKFATNQRPPHYHLEHPISVLEKNVETHVPIVITNLDAIRLSYETLTTRGKQPGQKKTFAPYKARDIAYPFPLKMRELIPGGSGAIQGILETTPIITHDEEHKSQWFFSQITPFHVHAKIGHHNTLIWVTTFDTGLPVDGVKVQIYEDQFGSFKENPKILSEGVTNAQGIALLAGTSAIDPELKLIEQWDRFQPRLFVRVQKDNDMALVPAIYDFQVQSYGANDEYIYADMRRRYGHIHTWGTTAQGIYKVGDTVQYKFYMRDQGNEHFIPAPRNGYSLEVIDPTGKVVHEVKEVTLSEFGAYSGEFTIPPNSATGWYHFVVSANFSKESKDNKMSWEPMWVLVSDFTPAPFRVTTDLDGELFKPGDIVKVTTQAKLHAGGPYANAQARITASVRSYPLEPQDPKAKEFYFDVYQDTDTETLFQTEGFVNDQGTLETQFKVNQARVLHGRLKVESAVRDDRGKYIANLATANYVGRDRYVGIRQPDWVLTVGRPAQILSLVVNEQGQLVAGTEIQVKVEHLQTKAAQVKGAGNAYLTNYVHEWVPVSECKLASETQPVVCEFTPAGPGTYKMTARIIDTQGREHKTSTQRWAVGKGEVLWETTPGNTLQVFAEKNEYKVGEKARYLVQNPYPGAKALITIERYGVQKSWVDTFNDSTAVIEFPISPEHIPGFYLSVVVMAPRVDKPLDENQVDLGKPAFRMSYVQTSVKDSYKEILVDIKPRQEVYKPRQVATIDLHAHTRQGESPPMELAVVVLDEAVFDLISRGKGYFDPYKGFYYLDSLEALDLRNYNLLTQLIGRQKFEKKGANAGGDGGLGLDLRSVFKFVSYWNPSLKPDANGKATIEFTLPDNLTGWRVFALAVTPEDQMGLGEGHFKANQPTEIRPALPNQVTEGDSFQASFTVMNRTDAKRTLDVLISAEGPIQTVETTHQKVETEPYKRYTVRIPIQTNRDGEIKLKVRAGDSQDQDGLEVPLTVRKRQALEVASTYGTMTSNEVKETVEFPRDIRTDVGYVSVTAAPTVLGGLEGAFKYMRDYPYICWEQILSKGVMAAHYRNLKPYLPDTLDWYGSQDLPEQTLQMAAGYQAPNGGMTYYIPQDQYASPYLSAYTALAFNWLRSSDYEIPRQVEDKLHIYLLEFLRKDVMPDFYSKGMASTVRAVALAALANHGKINLSDLRRYHSHVAEMSLFGKAHYLMALSQISGTNNLQSQVMNKIRTQGNETGGKFIFSETLDDGFERILESSLRTNCAILSAFLAYEAPKKRGGDRASAPPSSDVPFKLVRTITQARKHRGHWENTQENMFCMNALVNFSRMYEKDKPSLTLRTFVDSEKIGQAQFQDYKDEPVDFQRPIQSGDPGRKATVKVEREGTGRIYYATRIFYSPNELKAEAINSGIEVHREYSVERNDQWVLLQNPLQIKTGELVRVDLYLSLPAARTFVVVDDPVPGGLEPVNRDLATASTVDVAKAVSTYPKDAFLFRYDDWRSFGYTLWSFYHKEFRHHSVRFYSEYLPAGRYHLSYVAQAIAPGKFTIMPLHVEEMYDPDVFGQGVPATLRVEEAQ
jgi:hypothetical protein